MAKKQSRFKRSRAERVKRNTTNMITDRSGAFGFLKDTGGLEVWYPKKKGIYNLSVIPYLQTREWHPENPAVEVGEDFIGTRPFGTHFISGQNLVCPRMTYGDECPICNLMFEYYTERSKYQKGTAEWETVNKVASKYKPKDMTAMVVEFGKEIGRCADDVEAGRYLFVWNTVKCDKFIKEAIKHDESKGDFFEFEGGSYLELDVCETGDGFKYLGLESKKDVVFKPRPDLDEDIIDEIPKLDEIFIVKSTEALQTLVDSVKAGTADDSDDSDDKEVAKPKKEKAVEAKKEVEKAPEKPKRGRKPKEEVEESPTTTTTSSEVTDEEFEAELEDWDDDNSADVDDMDEIEY